MAEQSQTLPPTQRRRWPRIVGAIVVLLVLLVVVAYFALSSSAFFKGVVLPRVGSALNAEVTVSRASISPFSRVVLHDLSVKPHGQETLLTAAEVRLEYNLRAILGGRLAVDRVLIESPSVTLVQSADGSSNLDPVLRAATGAEDESEESADAPQVEIKQVTLRNATLKFVQLSDDGSRQVTQLTNLNFGLSNLKNGAQANLKLSADLGMERTAAGDAAPASARGRIDGSGTFTLTRQLQPESAQANVTLAVSDADGEFADLALSTIELNCAITPTHVENLALAIARDGDSLGSVRVHGPFNLADLDGALTMETGPLDHRALNLVGAPMGVSFGSTRLHATNRIEIQPGAARVRVRGDLGATELSITQAGASTPPHEVAGSYDVSFDRSNEMLEVRSLEFIASREGAEVLRTALSRPMTISTGTNRDAFDDAELRITVNELNLGDWQSLLEGAEVAGRMNGEVNLGTSRGGFFVRSTATVQGLNATLAGSRVRDGELSLRLNAGVSELQPLTAAVDGNLTVRRGRLTSDDLPASDVPLESSISAKAGFTNDVLHLDDLKIALAPTSRARNELTLAGTIDQSDTNAMRARLTLTSESLDVGHYYDLFAGRPESADTLPPEDEEDIFPSIEPEPARLPVRDSLLEIRIGRLHLHEVEIRDCQARLTLDRDRVELDPFTLSLNGSPVKAFAVIGLGKPRYEYDVRLSAVNLPLAPLANSFGDEYRGKASGDVSASVEVSGRGITGPSLRETLAGNAGITITNANIQLLGPRAQLLVNTIAVALRQPALMQSPAQWLEVDTRFQDGEIVLSRFGLQTTAFRAGAQGRIPIADQITESPLNSLPIRVSLQRSIASRAGLLPANTPADVTYVELPVFLHATGTVTEPGIKTDTVALAGITARSLGASGLIGGEGKKIIEGIGRILGGSQSSGTQTNQNTNPPPTQPRNP